MALELFQLRIGDVLRLLCAQLRLIYDLNELVVLFKRWR